MNVQLISLHFVAFVQKPKYPTYLHVVKIAVKFLQQTISHLAISIIVYTDFAAAGEFFCTNFTLF